MSFGFNLACSAHTAACLALLSFFCTAIATGETWVDVTGKHKVEAEFVGLQGGTVKLRRTDGTSVEVPFDRLCAESQAQAREQSGEVAKLPPVSIQLKDAGDLERLAKQQRSAERALQMYKQFLAQQDLDSDQRAKAEKKLSAWEKRAADKLFRWGRRWETVEQIRSRVQEEEQLLKQAHRLIEVKNDKIAREKFEEASDANPEGVRADFYLGILHSLLGRYPKGALERFTLCVNRLERGDDHASGPRRSNFIAALNNRAICNVRRGKHTEALKDWAKAIEIAPQTPELVQNLGYYTQLSGTVSGWGVSRAVSSRIGDQYAQLTVANQSAAYSENNGFLFIPYVDAPTMPDFEELALVPERDLTAEELLNQVNNQPDIELRIAGWATGLAVDANHLLTSRAVAEGALGFWVRKDGRTVKTMPGKVVAVSGAHDLALIRIEGLQAEALPLETAESTRATDIHIGSFPEPGILSDGMLVQRGTIVDIASSFIPLGKKYLTRRVENTAVGQGVNGVVTQTNAVYETIAIPIEAEYVYGLIHDVQLNQGAEEAPLINNQGHVVGLDLGYERYSFSDRRYRTAVNNTEIRAFLETTGREFPALDAKQSGVIQDIDQFVENLAGNSVFQLAIVARVPRLSWSDRLGEIRGISMKSGWNAYEDPWCIRCNGMGEVACHGRRCVKGQVSYKEKELTGTLPGTNRPIYDTRWVSEDCTVCRGKGFLKCPHCGGSHVEPLLR